MPEKQADQPADDANAKFRSALEAKRHREQNRPAHLDAGSAVQGARGKAGGKREFHDHRR